MALGADRERGLLQPLARLGPERVGAGQSLAVAQQRQEPVARRRRARRWRLRHLRSGDRGAEAARRSAHGRGLRVGVDDPRNGLVVRSAARRGCSATTSPSYSPTWVSGRRPLTSPIAHRRRRTQVRVDRDAVRVASTPTVSRPSPPTRGRRPVATSRWSPRSSLRRRSQGRSPRPRVGRRSRR